MFGAEEAAAAAQFTNAVEFFPIYDTVQIREELTKGENKIYGFTSYAQLAAKQKVPFFNVRNSGEVGIPYTNLETKDQMPYVYRATSIGVHFSAPLGIPEQWFQGETLPIGWANPLSHALFVQEIPRHVAIRFKVMQDEKLIANTLLTPAGVGMHGVAGLAGIAQGNIAFTGVTSGQHGQPFLGNRYPFKEGDIEIPRGATFSAELEFSEYARALLTQMKGPGLFEFADDPNQPKTVPSCATIQVSLFGKREVQQRNALHR